MRNQTVWDKKNNQSGFIQLVLHVSVKNSNFLCLHQAYRTSKALL